MQLSLPKVSDVKNLQDLSKVIVLPLICASYIQQTGLTLNIGQWVFSIPEQVSPTIMFLLAICIFSAKAIFISVLAIILYFALFYCHLHLLSYRVNLIPAVALLFISFGFYGVLSDSGVNRLLNIQPSWFYASFVIGFFLLQANAQFENKGQPPLFRPDI